MNNNFHSSNKPKIKNKKTLAGLFCLFSVVLFCTAGAVSLINIFLFLLIRKNKPKQNNIVDTKITSHANSLVVMAEILKEGAESFHKCYRKGCS